MGRFNPQLGETGNAWVLRGIELSAAVGIGLVYFGRQLTYR